MMGTDGGGAVIASGTLCDDGSDTRRLARAPSFNHGGYGPRILENGRGGAGDAWARGIETSRTSVRTRVPRTPILRTATHAASFVKCRGLVPIASQHERSQSACPWLRTP